MTKSKFIRKTLRLKDYDYSLPGFYFITVCTFGKANLFGKIENNSNLLNVGGIAIESALLNLPNIFSHIKIVIYIVMPNHIHFIIEIKPTVSSKTISDIVKSFKLSSIAAYTHEVQANRAIPFRGKLWQKSFHDRIIRTTDDFNQKHYYITSNPLRWTLKNKL